MILWVDPKTLGANLYLLMAGAILLGVVLLFGLVGWTGLRAWIWHVKLRRSRVRYLREAYRSDGALYPPFSEGVCYACGRVEPKVYRPATGERLCPPCYERFWRRSECA